MNMILLIYAKSYVILFLLSMCTYF